MRTALGAVEERFERRQPDGAGTPGRAEAAEVPAQLGAPDRAVAFGSGKRRFQDASVDRWDDVEERAGSAGQRHPAALVHVGGAEAIRAMDTAGDFARPAPRRNRDVDRPRLDVVEPPQPGGRQMRGHSALTCGKYGGQEGLAPRTRMRGVAPQPGGDLNEHAVGREGAAPLAGDAEGEEVAGREEAEGLRGQVG